VSTIWGSIEGPMRLEDAVEFTSALPRDRHARWGLANVLAALQAGIVRYESTLGGIGGQPANFSGRIPKAAAGLQIPRHPVCLLFSAFLG
jgi:hypothetical protein